MLAHRTHGVGEEFKYVPTEFESMAQDPPNTLFEGPYFTDNAIPAVRKPVFVTELHTDEAFGESEVVVLIVVPDDVG